MALLHHWKSSHASVFFMVTHLDVRRAVDGRVCCLLLVLLRAVCNDHEESRYIDTDIIRNGVHGHVNYEVIEILMLYS